MPQYHPAGGSPFLFCWREDVPRHWLAPSASNWRHLPLGVEVPAQGVAFARVSRFGDLSMHVNALQTTNKQRGAPWQECPAFAFALVRRS